jgi:thiosulfate reductase cytochrome b subunit
MNLYNGLQRLACSAIIVIAAVEVLSGLAISKPVQLWWFGRLYGGYDGARAILNRLRSTYGRGWGARR